MMDEKLFNELKANLKQAVSFAKGRVAPETVYVVITPATIKAVRREVKMSKAVTTTGVRQICDVL